MKSTKYSAPRTKHFKEHNDITSNGVSPRWSLKSLPSPQPRYYKRRKVVTISTISTDFIYFLSLLQQLQRMSKAIQSQKVCTVLLTLDTKVKL